ncbi:MAG: PAS domain S-box protein, partial [Gemmataceae bacterium]
MIKRKFGIFAPSRVEGTPAELEHGRQRWRILLAVGLMCFVFLVYDFLEHYYDLNDFGFLPTFVWSGISVGLLIWLYRLMKSHQAESGKALEQIRENALFASTISHVAFDGIVILDQKLNIVEWNESASRILGWNASDTLQRPFNEFFLPDPRIEAHHMRVREKTKEGVQNIPGIAMDLKGRHVTGKVIPLDASIRSFRWQGEGYSVATFRDISDRRTQEELQQHTLRDLQERVKELTLIHHAARLIGARDLHPDQVMDGITQALPASFQFPDLAIARLTIGNKTFRSGPPGEYPHKIQANYSTRKDEKGAVEVFYREAPLSSGGDPFLVEEQNMLNSLAEMLGIFFDQRRREEELRIALDQARSMT